MRVKGQKKKDHKRLNECFFLTDGCFPWLSVFIGFVNVFNKSRHSLKLLNNFKCDATVS